MDGIGRGTVGMTRRFDSEFDPAELAKITHKGLQPRSKKDEPSVTHQKIELLKDAQQGEGKLITMIARFFGRIVSGIASSVKGLFAAPKKKQIQCENYGHILKPGWTGPQPICLDCGATISSMEQVRGATPKEDRQKNAGKSPFGKERKYVK